MTLQIEIASTWILKVPGQMDDWMQRQKAAIRKKNPREPDFTLQPDKELKRRQISPAIFMLGGFPF